MSENLNSNSTPTPTPNIISNLNSSEEVYLTLVHSYINATRDILNGYMTFETGLTRAINSQIFRNFTRSSFPVAAAAAAAAGTPRTSASSTSETTRQPVSVSVEPEPVIETPVNLIRRETVQIPIPDTPERPTLRFRSNLQSNSSEPSSPFQIPTPVRLTGRLDTPPEERESQRGVLPLPRRVSHQEASGSTDQMRNGSSDGGVGSDTPFASTFVRYRLPVPIGPARRVPAVVNTRPSESNPGDAPTTTVSANLRSALEIPVFSRQQSPPPTPPSAIPLGQTWQQIRQWRQQRRQDSLSLSPILPVEPTPLPPAPEPLTTATRLMLDLLDTPRLNDSLIYYTQIIDRENARYREGGGGLSYDVIQQQTKIIPYCTISNPLNDICPISQVQFDLIDSVMQINTCKHNFNPFSLLRWFDSHSTCPMCRQQINVDVDVDIENNDDDEQTIHMYNDGREEEEPYRSELNEHRENDYSFDSEF
jgi:hypothetical protein